jgi:hypothetical protein
VVLVVAVLSRTGTVDLRSADWLAGFVMDGVGEEVVDHAMEQGGELVQLGRGQCATAACCIPALPAWRIRRETARPAE